jgi:domain of unknown function
MPIKIRFSRLPFRVTAFHFSGIRYNVCRFLALKKHILFLFKRGKIMAKQKHALQTPPQNSQGTMTYQHQRGVIKENAIQALLHDKLFRQRLERKKKGKGSYQRQAKHANRYYEKPDNKISMIRDFIIGLFSIRKVYVMY